LLIEPCNYLDHPPGGQLSFVKQMIAVFGNRLALVGCSTDKTPVGVWIDKKIGDTTYKYLNIGRISRDAGKPLVPARLKAFLRLHLYKNFILSSGIRNAFINAPEVLIAISGWKFNSLCYCFHGVENPLKMSRYRWSRLFVSLFDRKLIDGLRYVDTILACADETAISSLIRRSSGKLDKNKVTQFPTRYNETIFYPEHMAIARKGLKLDLNAKIIVSTGRINRVKGWDLILEAFKDFKNNHDYVAKLIFVGDGEDRSLLQAKIYEYHLQNEVTITGFQSPDKVAAYLNAANIFVVGSYREGWSVSMLEALGCGKPIVSTNVSGAYELVDHGKNGYVINSRDPNEYAEAMFVAFDLPQINQVSLELAEKYKMKNLARDIGLIWRPLA